MIRLYSILGGLVLVGAAAAVVWPSERDTICAHGYAASRRPPEAWSQDLKRRMCAAVQPGAIATCMRLNELDHVIPLCLGGEPKAGGNLALEPWPEAHEKDRREAEACRAYCEGKLSLEAARALFR